MTPDAPGEPPEPPAASHGDRQTILVVEDNLEVLAASSRALKRAGFKVLQARDGDQALALIDDERLPIDLACVDGVIPGKGSAEVIARIRSRRPRAPIVVCSGYVDEDLLRRGIRTGELACVRKPFTGAQLLSCVREELRRQTLHNQSPSIDGP